jgi:ankyrin repeat protein
VRALRAVVLFATVLATGGCDAGPGPLHEAAATGNLEVIRAWIAKKRNLDATYDEPSSSVEGNYARMLGITALMTAARRGQFDSVKLLVEGGANLYLESNVRDGSNPRSAFDFAAADAAVTGRIGIVRYLWEKSDGVRFARRLGEHIAAVCRRTCDDKSGVDAQSNAALFLISVTRDEVALGKGIGQAACLSQRPMQILDFLDRHGVRFPGMALHCVIYDPTVRQLRSFEQRVAMAGFLLDRGVDIENPGTGFTPLMGAAFGQEVEMVKFLLARGAKPDTRNAAGVTALGVAANTCVHGGTAAEVEPRQKPQLDVIETLLQAGADARLYSLEGARSQVKILTDCCARKPHTATQRRICEVFVL